MKTSFRNKILSAVIGRDQQTHAETLTHSEGKNMTFYPPGSSTAKKNYFIISDYCLIISGKCLCENQQITLAPSGVAKHNKEGRSYRTRA